MCRPWLRAAVAVDVERDRGRLAGAAALYRLTRFAAKASISTASESVSTDTSTSPSSLPTFVTKLAVQVLAHARSVFFSPPSWPVCLSVLGPATALS